MRGTSDRVSREASADVPYGAAASVPTTVGRGEWVSGIGVLQGVWSAPAVTDDATDRGPPGRSRLRAAARYSRLYFPAAEWGTGRRTP
ncbi:hypothetical protein GCM10010358_75830 [Streptomyces minutiscleroticus]|uniref:Uncharacterized protein n=1 Tax=Streptomyces minutiscleroticus TaxID=68238 RepID=A0A918P1I4_9ACTN|nr:hypothetical protein GCM10010358_75830 [Streptomyces minutiscleroticus]